MRYNPLKEGACEDRLLGVGKGEGGSVDGTDLSYVK